MLKPIKILLTACGCPGASTLIRMLKSTRERKVEIVGVDMDHEAVGRFLTDSFYTVPAANQENDFIKRIIELVEIEKPDLLFPESSAEVPVLAKYKKEIEELGPKVMVSSRDSILLADNKYKMYQILEQDTELDLPDYAWPRSLEEFVKVVHELGYPDHPVCFKPHIGKGSRGFRILDANVNRRDLLLNYKPNSRYMALEEFANIFKEDDDFPDFLVMEYLEGQELTTDSICLDGEELLTTVKTVEQARWGVIVRGELVDRPDLIQQTREVLKAIPLSYCVNLQFIGGKLIEINPRVSSFIYQEDLIAPYLAIKLSLGEISQAELIKYQSKIDYNRRMVRFMDQLFYSAN